LSTTESEIVALPIAVVTAMWLKKLLIELGCTVHNEPIMVHEDNMATILACQNIGTSMRTPHHGRKHRFLYDNYETGEITFVHCPGEDMIADQLTKVLDRATHEKHSRWMVSKGDGSEPFNIVTSQFAQVEAKRRGEHAGSPYRMHERSWHRASTRACHLALGINSWASRPRRG